MTVPKGIRLPFVNKTPNVAKDAKESSGRTPAGPVGPVGPVTPVAPVVPVGPLGPVGPVGATSKGNHLILIVYFSCIFLLNVLK